MNKRQRKKQLQKLKNKGKYNQFDNSECWNLDHTMAEFILPRLKVFKKYTNGYPGIEPMDTYEKWLAALNKMILAFELIIKSDDIMFDSNNKLVENWKELSEDRNNKVQEGLHLFATYFESLWW